MAVLMALVVPPMMVCSGTPNVGVIRTSTMMEPLVTITSTFSGGMQAECNLS